MRRTLAVGLASLIGLAPDLAHACGCFSPPDPSVPLVQAGERILFSHADGEVTAHIQIQYDGASQQDFGWILPLPAVPTLELGVQELFDQLIATTQPRYILTTVTDPDCNNRGRGGALAGSSDDSAEGAGGSGGSSPVVVQDTVGPYDYAVLKADDKAEMFGWLEQNRFFVPAGTESAADPYIRPGAFFLALKLKSGQTAGDLQPVVVRYASDRAMIPIVLTSVAANPDMGVQVWLLGDARGIPVNYRHTVINDALIDWQGGADNYVQVLTAATNEAPSGQSFVTEYAGRTGAGDLLLPAGRFADAASLAQLTTASGFVAALAERGFETRIYQWQGGQQGGPIGPPARRGAVFGPEVRSVLRMHVTMPPALRSAGVDEAEFYGAIEYYLGDFRRQNPEAFAGWEDRIDAAAATALLEERFAAPLRKLGALFAARQYLTRLFTTLSPEEMTADPVFDFNPQLEDYSNEHHATLTITCDQGFGGEIQQARVLSLPSDRNLLVAPDEAVSVWTTVAMPPNQRTERLPLEGKAIVEADRTGEIDQAIRARNASVRARYPGLDWAPDVGKDGGCAAAPGARGSSGALLLALALGSIVRRRRR